MPAFSRYAPLAEALDWLARLAAPPSSESVTLAEAAGRVLAEDLAARSDHPPFDRATLDGFALQGLDTAGAGAYGPVSLRLMGRAGPGLPPALAPGAALYTEAGAPLPAGADAVAPLTFAEAQAGWLELSGAVAPGDHIARRGADFRAGEPLLSAGRVLRPADLAVLAAAGHLAVPVRRRPRVRILIAGAGLAPAAGAVPGTVPEAAAAMLGALVLRDGGTAEPRRLASRTPAALAGALRKPDADLILVAGASGEGEDDGAAEALAAAGALAFHGIALEPARSAGAGTAGPVPVVLLPGDPYAGFCGYEVLAAPLLRRLAGRDEVAARPVALARKLATGLGAAEFRLLRLGPAGAEPLPQGLPALAAADGFLLVPETSEGYAAGTTVPVNLYHSP